MRHAQGSPRLILSRRRWFCLLRESLELLVLVLLLALSSNGSRVKTSILISRSVPPCCLCWEENPTKKQTLMPPPLLRTPHVQLPLLKDTNRSCDKSFES